MKQTTKPEQAKHRSKIGGQALIEGVMMKGVHTGAMACRLPDGTIDVETWEEHNGKEMPWYRKWLSCFGDGWNKVIPYL